MQKEISAFAEKSDRRWQNDAGAALGQVKSLQRLNDLLREWGLEQSQLDAWDRRLFGQSQILVAQEKEVARIVETWQATRAAGKQQALPKVALSKIDEVLREADAVHNLIRDGMAKLLDLQNQLANRRDILKRIHDDLERAREESSRDLFVLDSLPLWEAVSRFQAQDVNMAEAVQSARRLIDDWHEFRGDYGDRILWHVLLFLSMIVLFHVLRRGTTPEAVERLGGSSASFLLGRPSEMSFLLALVAMPLIYPEAPARILRIAIFPSVIPLIRLLPRLLPRMFRSWVYVLAALYILDFLRNLLPHDWLLTRVLLLVISTGGCAAFGFFSHTQGAELSASGFRERLTLLAVRVALFLFAASVLSNLAGNLTLAEFLVATPVRITYAAALIYAGAQLLLTLTAVALQSRSARRLRSVRVETELFASRCRTFIRIAALVFWAVVTLNMIGVLSDVWAAGAALLQWRWKLGAAEISVQDLAVFFTVCLGAFIFSRMLRFVLTEEVFPRIRLPRGVPGAVDVLSRYGIMLLGFFIALAAAGVDLSKITLLISALGVGIGFGLQPVVNNFVSGLILVFEHPVQAGDFVEVGPIFGQVRKIGFRASVLRTPDGADVIIPNGELVGAKFVNWSLSDRLRRINISVGAAYGTDPDRVISILLEIARKHPAVLAEPAPLAVFDRFGDSALNFTLFCWSYVDNFFIIRSELTIAINNAFKEAGIQIPLPQQDVHVHWSGEGGTTAGPVEASTDADQTQSGEARRLVSAKTALAQK
jgi:small-conductance mechanosensitive channel